MIVQHPAAITGETVSTGAEREGLVFIPAPASRE